MKKLRKFTEAFQGHQGNEQGASHGGNRLRSIRPVIIFKSFKFNVYLWTLCFASYKKYPNPLNEDACNDDVTQVMVRQPHA